MIEDDTKRDELISELRSRNQLRGVLDECLTYQKENVDSELWEKFDHIGIQSSDIGADPDALSKLCELGFLERTHCSHDHPDHYRVTDLEVASDALTESYDILSEFIQNGPLEGRFETSVKPFSDCEQVDNRELPVIDAVCWERDSKTAWVLESQPNLTTDSAVTALGRLLGHGRIFERYEVRNSYDKRGYEDVRFAAVFGDGFSFSTYYQMEVFNEYAVRAFQKKKEGFKRIDVMID